MDNINVVMVTHSIALEIISTVVLNSNIFILFPKVPLHTHFGHLWLFCFDVTNKIIFIGFQDTLVCSVPIEETAEHRKGLRKNLRGKWRRLVHKKQQQQDAYKIPAELRDQLKQIYVYWF